MVKEVILKYIKDGLSQGYSLDALKKRLLEAGYNEADVNDAINSLNKDTQVIRVSSSGSNKTNAFSAVDKSETSSLSSGEDFKGLSFFQKIKKIIASPSDFFEDVKKEKISCVLKYQLKILLIPFLATFLLLFLFFSFISSLIGLALGPLIGGKSFSFAGFGILFGFVFALFLGLVYFIVLPIMTFVGAGILHLFVKLFKGSGTYSDTYRVVAYSAVPSYLFGWIPFIGLATSIWAIVLNVIGISKYHKISHARSVLVIVVITIIIVLIGLGISLLAFLMINPSVNTTYNYNSGVVYNSLNEGQGGSSLGNFNFVIDEDFTKCKNGSIRVYARNLGLKDIKKEDWKIHKVDGVDVSVWDFAGIGNSTSSINWGIVLWPSEKYPHGKHVIELGTSEDNVRTFEVVC